MTKTIADGKTVKADLKALPNPLPEVPQKLLGKAVLTDSNKRNSSNCLLIAF